MQIFRKKGKTVWKSFWGEIGGKRHYFKSMMEYNYGLYLEWLKVHGEIKDWLYEPETFWFEGIRRGVTNYKPDYRVEHLNGRYEYIEVKGYMDQKSRTKLDRMKKYHPLVKMRLIDMEWFKINAPKLKMIIPQWLTLKKFEAMQSNMPSC